MTTYVALLRAINVGGRNKIPMAELRELLGELGFSDVATYIQSGNVVCSSRKKSASVSTSIATGIKERFGHDIDVIVRTAAELDGLIDNFPYGDADPKSSGVVFLAAPFSGDVDASAFAPDECRLAGADVYVNCPSGFGATKLTAAWITKQSGTPCTRRNHPTLLALQALAEGSASAS